MTEINPTDIIAIFEMKEKDPEKYERFMKFIGEDYIPTLTKTMKKVMEELEQ